jgi:heme-degrading monooxygenase HmoA
MIVRLWTTHVADGREAEYLAFAQDRSRLMFLSQPGCLGVLFLRAIDGKHVACSFWKSSADIESLASSSSYNATASELAATGILLGQATITVYDVEGGGFNGSTFATILDEFGILAVPVRNEHAV